VLRLYSLHQAFTDKKVIDFYNRFKPIRNKIRTYDAPWLIKLAMEKLYEIRKLPIYKAQGYLPWNLLFLIKLAFIEGSASYPPRKPTPNDLAHLIHAINELGNHNRLLTEKSHSGIMKLKRTLAFQQFWLQHPISQAHLGRQLLLFDKLQWKQYERAVREKLDRDISGQVALN
jgi:hypothetical protein